MFAEFPGPRTRPPEKLPFVEIFAVISVRTHTTDNKAQGTLEAKGASKGFTAAATRKFVQAPHEGD